MSETLVLGIDAGGTHTDAALLSINAENSECKVLAHAKTITRHDNLPASIGEAVIALGPAAKTLFHRIERVTLGATLEINAIVQNKADKVGLALSSGPGLDPVHFILGENFCIVPGGLDHRGVEVEPLYLDTLKADASNWLKQGVAAIACVGKFSPRNPEHENAMAKVAAKATGLPVTLGHKLSGKLNFPRRIATAYYNAAVDSIHQNFLNSVESALSALGISAQLRLLKADGGAIPFNISRNEPVQSILSGPAASVMGVLALWAKAKKGCSLLLDMGGTTTDIAMFSDGSPVIDRNGMELNGRRTLVNSLASTSIGVGGDSRLRWQINLDGEPEIIVGPERTGPAMAFGGDKPTFLDALNVLDQNANAGDLNLSSKGIENLARECGLNSGRKAAQLAVKNGMDKIVRSVYDLVENINSKPIYTLAGLKAVKEARPQLVCLVGGPAFCVAKRLQDALGLSVEIGPYSQIANAIGAAVALPTSSLEIYADTLEGALTAPALDYSEQISRNFNLEQAKEKARELLQKKLQQAGVANAEIEITEADLFATLDDAGHGGKDMRVVSQVRPGIAGTVLTE